MKVLLDKGLDLPSAYEIAVGCVQKGLDASVKKTTANAAGTSHRPEVGGLTPTRSLEKRIKN